MGSIEMRRWVPLPESWRALGVSTIAVHALVAAGVSACSSPESDESDLFSRQDLLEVETRRCGVCGLQQRHNDGGDWTRGDCVEPTDGCPSMCDGGELLYESDAGEVAVGLASGQDRLFVSYLHWTRTYAVFRIIDSNDGSVRVEVTHHASPMHPANISPAVVAVEQGAVAYSIVVDGAMFLRVLDGAGNERWTVRWWGMRDWSTRSLCWMTRWTSTRSSAGIWSNTVRSTGTSSSSDT